MKDPSTRDVIEYLRLTLRVSSRQAHHALLSGLAGVSVSDGRARRYDLERARSLGHVAELSDDEVWEACPQGVFVARIGPRRHFHVSQSRDEKIAAVADDWYVPLFSHLWLNLHDGPDGTFPFIATVADFIVLGATIAGREVYGEEQHSTNRCFQLTRFTLTAPGPWYDALEGRRLTLGPGYPWKIWGAPVSAPFDRTGLVDDDVISAAAARAARRRGRPRPPAPQASHPPSAGPPPARSA